jgi:transcriptional regulator with XRE-family HTH domain
MEENDYETRFIREEIGRCEDLEELKARIFPLLQSQQELWIQKMQEILAESGLTKSAFAKRCRVSRVSVDKWCKGAIPKNRETFLRIGMAAEYDLEKMNQLLRRYGQYPELYSKSLEDCVCIYVLNHRVEMDGFGNSASEKRGEAYGLTAYDYILSQIKENMAADANMEIPDINTAQFAERLSQVEDADALTQFIYDNIATFSSAYQKFYAYVKMYVTINYQRYSSSVANLAEGQGWSSSLRQCVSAIRQNKWYPTRNKIISLGLHLSMDHEQIDEMLTLAHMEPLCAKNLFESVILFILDDAELNNMLDTESEEFDPDELCRYARKVLLELDLPEIDAFLAELPDLDTDIW